ncbi:MAG: nicotinate phosphoribosyltransferase [Candidatus Kapabacteria bacterium]|nr:nicotinate phosphoribosyltransferase [Candidatus Kapabacteria bacterium]MDW8225422.1 nicotinate phosphoribosyltransferase [Bacteroidota bacterium]
MVRDFLHHLGLYTDLYELTMAQGYFLSGRADVPATFEYFFRSNPFNGGYVVFAGLGELVEALLCLSFSEEDLDYLRRHGFQDKVLEYLRTFRFRGSLWSVREGEIVFPREPIVRVEGGLLEIQLVETLVLNLLNFASLIATKAMRIRWAAGERFIADFGLRRAQGWGGMLASKAAYIGGVDATSNVAAGMLYGIPITGTQAHSWIQSFGDELEAFRTFAQIYPDRCVLLVDTYNTLASGIPNAIRVAKELEASGYRLLGIRIDSGDLAALSKRARQMLDEAGLTYVKIFTSNQLDEYVVRSLLQQGAPVDGFGIGTRLVTAYDCPALDGVYKLVECGGYPTLKVSDDFTKVLLPGRKRLFRYRHPDGSFAADGISLIEEASPPVELYHPFYPMQRTLVSDLSAEPLLQPVLSNGKLCSSPPSLAEVRAYAAERFRQLPDVHKRFENPHLYTVGISRPLMELRDRLVREALRP